MERGNNMESVKLNRENLSQIQKQVSVFGYNQQDLSSSIVHLGLGNFHRAHQAAYLDELLEMGLEKSGIFEINLIPDSFPLGKILGSQDYLYTLVTKNAAGQEKIRVIGSILGYLNASENKEAVFNRIADSRTSVITLTVTEKGYYFDRKTGEIDSRDVMVRGDLEHPGDPKTAAGFLAESLFRRYKTGRKPLTIMSCDNIPSNGKVLENCVHFYCRELFPEIIAWMEDEVSFPCSMVDRITPVTTPSLVNEIENHYHISDLWPVCGEDFRQWVLEDNFKTPVPRYGEAGVQIVKNVEPYELMKMRLLNGSHSAMAYPCYLLGCQMVDEGISNPLIKKFIRERYMEEVTPTLAPVPGIDLTVYKDTLISRFSNRNIGDTILRLCSEGSSKIPNFMLKPLADAIRQDLPPDTVIFGLAAWARFLEGKDEAGKPIPLEDVNGPLLSGAAQRASSDPKAFLNAAGLEELSPIQSDTVTKEFKTALDSIHRNGTRKALEMILNIG